MKWPSLLLSIFKNISTKATATASSHSVREFRSRLLWEVVAVIFSMVIGYLVSHFSNHTTLQACQDERTALLKQHSRHQALLDSLHFAAKIEQKDQQILQKDETILLLSQRIRSDSIAHLTELQAIRAINQHIKPKK